MQGSSRSKTRFPSFSLPPLHPRTLFEALSKLVETLKIAFLCEIPYDRLIAFRQAIEDSVNSANGKLIYVLKSNNRIRLQESIPSGEEVKVPPPYTGPTPSRVVKDAERDANRRLGFNDHSCRGSSCGPCGDVSKRHSASECLQECDWRQRNGWRSRNAIANLDRCSRSLGVRLRFPTSYPRGPEVVIKPPWVADGSPMAQPSFLGM